MKKTLLIAAAALAAGVISTQAAVYSQNIVGYVNTTMAAGNYTMCTTPLQVTNSVNNAESVLPSANAGDSVLLWNGAGFDTYIFAAPGTWIGPSGPQAAPTLNPGTPFFYFNTGAQFTNTFVGTVTTSNVVSLAAGNYTMCAPAAPIADSLEGTNLNLPLVAGDNVLFWNGSSYDTYIFAAPGTWIGPSGPQAAPTPAVGQAFFYFNTSSQRNWTNNVVIQ